MLIKETECTSCFRKVTIIHLCTFSCLDTTNNLVQWLSNSLTFFIHNFIFNLSVSLNHLTSLSLIFKYDLQSIFIYVSPRHLFVIYRGRGSNFELGGHALYKIFEKSFSGKILLVKSEILGGHLPPRFRGPWI